MRDTIGVSPRSKIKKLSPLNDKNVTLKSSVYDSVPFSNEKSQYDVLNMKLQFPKNPAYSHMKNVGTSDSKEAMLKKE